MAVFPLLNAQWCWSWCLFLFSVLFRTAASAELLEDMANAGAFASEQRSYFVNPAQEGLEHLLQMKWAPYLLHSGFKF